VRFPRATRLTKYRADHAGEEPPLTVSERARLREAERQLREVADGERVPKKSRGVLRPGSSTVAMFEFIDSCRSGTGEYAYPVKKMCQWLVVSPSGFFDWKRRPDSATHRRRDHLKVLVREAFTRSEQTYGYRRVHAQLARWGIACGPELVRDVMVELGLRACQPRPARMGLTARDLAAGPIPDLVARDFPPQAGGAPTAEAPGQNLVGDTTYIPTWEGWVYLATVIDCYSKMVIGYAVGDHYRTSLITAALRRAASRYRLQPGAIFHSDRGSNSPPQAGGTPTSAEFATTITALGMRRSVGRTGICYDNVMAESFFAALKNERVSRTVYPTREHARRDITRYIERWYNPRRLHSSLDYKTPQEVHNGWLNTQVAA